MSHLRQAWRQRIAATDSEPPCPRCGGILQDNGEVFHFDGTPLYRGIIVKTTPDFTTDDPTKLAAAFKAHLSKSVGEHFSRDSYRALETFALPGHGYTGFFISVDGWKCEDTKDVDSGYSYENEVAFKQGARMRLQQLRVYPDPDVRSAGFSKWDNKWNIESLVGRDIVAGDWSGRRAMRRIAGDLPNDPLPPGWRWTLSEDGHPALIQPPMKYGPVMTEAQAKSRGWHGPFYHGADSVSDTASIRQRGFRLPMLEDYELEDWGTIEEVLKGDTIVVWVTKDLEAAKAYGDGKDAVMAYLRPGTYRPMAAIFTGEPALVVDDVANIAAISDRKFGQRVAVNDIPLDQIVYIAEGAMERAGYRGKRWSLARGHPDQVPEVKEDLDAIRQYATEAGRFLGYGYKIRVNTGDDAYAFMDNPKATGMTNVQGTITVRYNTNDLTILHEVAHVVTNTVEGAGGHSEDFCRAAHKLYTRFISPAAGEIFWNIVGERL